MLPILTNSLQPIFISSCNYVLHKRSDSSTFLSVLCILPISASGPVKVLFLLHSAAWNHSGCNLLQLCPSLMVKGNFGCDGFLLCGMARPPSGDSSHCETDLTLVTFEDELALSKSNKDRCLKRKSFQAVDSSALIKSCPQRKKNDKNPCNKYI